MVDFTVIEPVTNSKGQRSKAKIKVIGVGGGGNNAVSEMWRQRREDDNVELIIVNTDLDVLEASPVPHKVQIGKETTKGQGAGSDANKGRQAAEENSDELKEALKGADIVFIASGMGGGTGTGASPVVARIVRELGILSIAIVTKPFRTEGRQRARIAEQGVAALREEVDSLIVIPNDKINDIFPNALMKDAFRHVNMVLIDSVKSLMEIISEIGIINADMNDVRTLMSKRGTAMICYADAEGQDRAINATQAAMSSPLLENINLNQAKGVLVHVSASSSSITMNEFNTVLEQVQEVQGEEFNEEVFKAAMSSDDSLGNRLRVIIFATGIKEPGEEERGGDGLMHDPQQQSAMPPPPSGFGNNYGAGNMMAPPPPGMPNRDDDEEKKKNKGFLNGLFG